MRRPSDQVSSFTHPMCWPCQQRRPHHRSRAWRAPTGVRCRQLFQLRAA